jgi:hypothetical protein
VNPGTFKKGEKKPNQGRPKGVLNKNNQLIRDMITQALDHAGGVEYLANTAVSHPAAFLALVGKVMPVQITGEGGGPVSHSLKVEFISGKAT